MFTKILFATNASPACDAAAKIAFELAQKYDAELTLFHVFGEPSRGVSQRVKSYATGQNEEPGPGYVDFIKQEMQTTYADLIAKHTTPVFAANAGIPPGQKSIETRITAAKEKIQEQYVSQMDNFDNYEISVWEGVPYVELLKYARESRADLIVMAHHTREVYPEETLFGSTVEQVVLRSACPVASVNRPDKF
ncbi:MAG: universal stress protein [Desulfobacteraceae bacterium]|nr:universal stress protein [Desulfobacteraceae bacterium]